MVTTRNNSTLKKEPLSKLIRGESLSEIESVKEMKFELVIVGKFKSYTLNSTHNFKSEVISSTH